MSPRRIALLLAVALAGCAAGADRWTQRGDVLLREGRHAEAERAYNEALARDPHHAAALYGKGWALLASGHDHLREPARQLFQRAVDYAPDYFGGYRGLAVLAVADGRLMAAENLLRQADARRPGDPSVLETYGQLYLRAGRLADAERLLRGALASDPGRGELYRFLADVERERGDLPAALSLIETGRSSSVSGAFGLTLLDEGEVLTLLAVAEAALRDGAGPSEALPALDRADSVFSTAWQRGIALAELAPTKARLETLRRRAEEARQD